MNGPLAGALVLFVGWIGAFTVMARRAQRRPREDLSGTRHEPPEDVGPRPLR
jgi:hypothetical protein